MRLVVQRVSSAEVSVEEAVVGSIGRGLVALVGVGRSDPPEVAEKLAEKVARLRIFRDDAGKMNLSLDEAGGEILVVSQFTLYGDTRKGNRPSFVEAAEPAIAEARIGTFVRRLRDLGVPVQQGSFGADMQVSLVNDGPVTILMEA